MRVSCFPCFGFTARLNLFSVVPFWIQGCDRVQLAPHFSEWGGPLRFLGAPVKTTGPVVLPCLVGCDAAQTLRADVRGGIRGGQLGIGACLSSCQWRGWIRTGSLWSVRLVVGARVRLMRSAGYGDGRSTGSSAVGGSARRVAITPRCSTRSAPREPCASGCTARFARCGLQSLGKGRP